MKRKEMVNFGGVLVNERLRVMAGVALCYAHRPKRFDPAGQNAGAFGEGI